MRINVHWGGVTDDNSFGTHEFMNFAELVGADPYVSINVGSADAVRCGAVGRIYDLRREGVAGQ